MGDICRTCSQEADPATANNLFDPSSASLLVQIEDLTHIMLQNDDNLPKWICQNCLLDLKIATDFRRVCIEAQELLQLQGDRAKAEENGEGQWIDGALSDGILCPPEDVINFVPEVQDDLSEISKKPQESEYLTPSLVLDEYATIDCSAETQFSDETLEEINVESTYNDSNEIETIYSPDSTNYTCSNCGLGFDDAEELRTHKYQLHDVSTDTKFVCDHCEEGFRTAAELAKHCNLLKHPCIHECVKCTAKFHSKILLDTHSEVCQLSTIGNKVCHICGKRLSSAFVLKTHLLRHSGKRPHKCSQCDAAFTVAAELKTHMNTHSSERSFVCRYNCGKSFRFSSARSSHERIHMDDSKRIYYCEYCPKSFVTPSACRAHQKQHSSDGDHRCDTCHISFRQRKHYQNHLKSNTHKVLEARAAAATLHPYFPH
ncbi:zinc finger protein 333 [Drosophila serrata]|uniref:zinc finger protein 333 n=1 Tax=Drosophila serrata TaxID=7274 RepID=UPI000A1D34AD|nr:zinc finger protein 333 [Drosophila serrata]